MTDYKTYDSDDTFTMHHARLVKDAEWRTGGTSDKGGFAKLTFVSTSKREGDEKLWIEVLAPDSQADVARNLRKGDVLSVSGKLTARKNGDKLYFSLKYAKLHIPVGLLMDARQRGEAPAHAPAHTNAPAPRKAPRPVIQLDDEM